MSATIRVAVEGDAGAIADIYAPIVADTHLSFETVPPSEGEIAERIRDTLQQYPWLVCECDGTVIGYSYAGPYADRPAYRWTVVASVYVAEQWRRHGVARGLYESLFALLREQDFYRVYAVIALPNPSSVALHESLGFRQIARYEKAGFKHGDWHDVGRWEYSLQSPETPPSPTTPFAEFRPSDCIDDALLRGESHVRL